MNKSVKRIVSVILVFAVIFSMSACTVNVKNDSINSFSIMKDAVIMGELNGDTSTSPHCIEIQFPEKRCFDTVVLENDNHRITEFAVSVKDENGDYQEVYKQDSVGDYRYCEIGEHTSDCVKININSANENQFKLKNIDVLNVSNNKNEDFRVTSYIVCPTYYAEGTVDTEKIKSITDVILFGIARFNENGEIYLQDSDINSQNVSGDEIFKSIIKDLKNANPDIKIHCNALGPDGMDADNKEELHSQAFVDNGDKLAANIMDLLVTYDFDGFFFDYEYPYKAKSRRDFSKFIVKLDEVKGEYVLGASLSEWNCSLSKSAIKALDRVEIMAYDAMNEFGLHSDFGTKGGALSVNTFEKKGYDLTKCDLGLPFYGRTHGGDEAWPSYAQIAADLENNPYKNIIQKSYLTGEASGIITSFNGVQMIKDKTAFANDYGLGGVMIWHYSCDVAYESEMSLFKAIQTALETRE